MSDGKNSTTEWAPCASCGGLLRHYSDCADEKRKGNLGTIDKLEALCGHWQHGGSEISIQRRDNEWIIAARKRYQTADDHVGAKTLREAIDKFYEKRIGK